MASKQQTSALANTVARRREVALKALEVFRGWGYREVEIPLLDYFDPLRSVLDSDDASRMFRFVDRDGNLLVLRADVTPAMAKLYAYQLAERSCRRPNHRSNPSGRLSGRTLGLNEKYITAYLGAQAVGGV